MSLKTWWRGFRYSSYDSRGNAKCLLGRETDPTQSDVEGVPPEVRDAALKAICKSFDITQKQMYCLRATDELMTIYRDMNGPRTFDQLQFERLGFEIEDAVGSQLSVSEILNIKTVADVIRGVAQRRGITDLHDAQPASRRSAPLEYASVSSPRRSWRLPITVGVSHLLASIIVTSLRQQQQHAHMLHANIPFNLFEKAIRLIAAVLWFPLLDFWSWSIARLPDLGQPVYVVGTICVFWANSVVWALIAALLVSYLRRRPTAA
jgi:hypothetical protein